MRRLLVLGLALTALVLTAVPARAANVALFFNPTYVDTATDGTGEAYNLQQGLIAQGHSVTTFTGITANAIRAALVGRTILVIPELQNNNLSPDLAPDAATVIGIFVANGGTLMVFDPGVGDPLAVINKSFPSFQLTSAGPAVGTIDKTPDATGTPFEGGPATLPINLNAVDTVLTASLPSSQTQPVGSKVIYQDDTGNAVVAQIAYGNGNILILGWDWFNAAPVGSQDGGWLTLLDIAGNDVIGAESIPTLSEWAMIAMAGMLAVAGVAALRRPRRAV